MWGRHFKGNGDPTTMSNARLSSLALAGSGKSGGACGSLSMMFGMTITTRMRGGGG
jgi:hypothetical protein